MQRFFALKVVIYHRIHFQVSNKRKERTESRLLIDQLSSVTTPDALSPGGKCLFKLLRFLIPVDHDDLGVILLSL